jgi:hypothetical protein
VGEIEDVYEAEYDDEILPPPPPWRNPPVWNPPPEAPVDEGFDGGPIDLSLLPSFEKYIDVAVLKR